MGVPTSEVGYTPAMPRRVDHEVHKGHVVALGGGNKKKHWNWKGTDVKIQGQIAYRQNDRILKSDEELHIVKESVPAVLTDHTSKIT